MISFIRQTRLLRGTVKVKEVYGYGIHISSFPYTHVVHYSLPQACTYIARSLLIHDHSAHVTAGQTGMKRVRPGQRCAKLGTAVVLYSTRPTCKL